jgi:hypothetical protein
MFAIYYIIRLTYVHTLVGRLNCCQRSPAQSFFASSLLEIHGQNFYHSPRYLRVLEVGPSLTREEASVFLRRRCVLCTIGNPVPNWQLNCCWSSPAQRFLVPSHMGLVTIFYCLAATGVPSLSPQPWGPGPCIYVPQGQGGPVIAPDTGFTFHLLRLADFEENRDDFTQISKFTEQYCSLVADGSSHIKRFPDF